MKYTQVKQASGGPGYWRRFADGWNMLVHPIDNWDEWGRNLVKQEVNDVAGSAGRSFGEQAAAGAADQVKKETPGLLDTASQWIGDKFKGGMSQGAAALGGAAVGGLLGYGLGGMGGKKRKPLRTLATVAGAGLGALGGYWLYDKLGKKASMNYSDIQRLRKTAALGWKADGNNMTARFADLQNKQLQQSAGFTGGMLGALATAGLKRGQTSKEQLPDFDPETGAYIGKSYNIPTSEADMQKLHKRMVGEEWQRSCPKWLEWMLASRQTRIQNSIRDAIRSGDANIKGLSKGELASLVFPYVLKEDGSVVRNLGLSRWNPYPVMGAFSARPITKKDIQEYLDKQRAKR